MIGRGDKIHLIQEKVLTIWLGGFFQNSCHSNNNSGFSREFLSLTNCSATRLCQLSPPTMCLERYNILTQQHSNRDSRGIWQLQTNQRKALFPTASEKFWLLLIMENATIEDNYCEGFFFFVILRTKSEILHTFMARVGSYKSWTYFQLDPILLGRESEKTFTIASFLQKGAFLLHVMTGVSLPLPPFTPSPLGIYLWINIVNKEGCQ